MTSNISSIAGITRALVKAFVNLHGHALERVAERAEVAAVNAYAHAKRRQEGLVIARAALDEVARQVDLAYRDADEAYRRAEATAWAVSEELDLLPYGMKQ